MLSTLTKCWSRNSGSGRIVAAESISPTIKSCEMAVAAKTPQNTDRNPAIWKMRPPKRSTPGNYLNWYCISRRPITYRYQIPGITRFRKSESLPYTILATLKRIGYDVTSRPPNARKKRNMEFRRQGGKSGAQNTRTPGIPLSKVGTPNVRRRGILEYLILGIDAILNSTRRIPDLLRKPNILRNPRFP